MSLLVDISELPPEVRKELCDGRHAREVAALQEAHVNQHKLARQLQSDGLNERRAVDGIGAAKLEITPEAFHYWGAHFKRNDERAGIVGTTGYECWKDAGFVREFARDNPSARVRCHGTRIQVGWTGNVRSRQTYA
jgi:hypothetical protein